MKVCEVCGKDTKVADISVVSDFLKSLLNTYSVCPIYLFLLFLLSI